tara:strand:+ start:1407 stop:1601 length:195 start_codon:yes stop_codon:yes gene_type:complete
MEQKVYIIDVSYDDFQFPDLKASGSLEEFMDIAESQGNVYSLNGFAKAFNEGRINSHTDIIRII